MKSLKIFSTALLVVCFAMQADAQTAKETEAQKEAKSLIEYLDLENESQVNTIKSLYDSYEKSYNRTMAQKGHTMSAEEKKSMDEKMDRTRTERLKGILNAAQFEKYQEWRAAKK